MQKITIITVTYNLIEAGRKEFFKQCCESVANQTYPNIEHLIVDGASTDGTLELIEECKHPRMRVISEPDNGMWDAMNKAIDYTKGGGYINYLNSDDYLFSDDIIEKCMNNLERTGADFSIANFRFRTIDNKPICDALENCPHGRRELFWMQMFYNHETLICKKAVYLKYGKHNLKYKTCIDNYWCIQLVMKGCSSCSTDEIMFVGRAEGSSTGADGKASPEAVKNFTILYKDFWSKYKFKESECADMLWNGTYSARFMRHVKKHVNALNLKNFDYEFFNKDIDERIQKIDIETIMNKKQYIAILSVLTKYKKKKIRNKIERCKRYLAKHKLAYNLMRDI